MMVFKVKLFNDCKEKWQSHEASFTMVSAGLDDKLTVDAYGASKEESLNSLVDYLERVSHDLLMAIKQIKNGSLEFRGKSE